MLRCSFLVSVVVYFSQLSIYKGIQTLTLAALTLDSLEVRNPF